MPVMSSVGSVPGLVLAALAIASTSTLCLDYNGKQANYEPVLCTLEESGLFSDSFDIVQLAKDMASARVHEVANFSINRTVISSEDVFDFVKNGCSLLNPYCAAIITIASCPVVLVIDDWTGDLSIPHVIYSIEANPCHVDSSHSVHLTPVGPIKSDVVDVLVQKLKWKELVFIYDDFLDLEQLSQLRSVLSKSLVNYGAFNIHRSVTNQTIEDAMVATRELQHVLLAVSSTRMEQVLQVANNTGLFSKDYKWMVLSNTSCVLALNRTVLRGSSLFYLRQTPVIKDFRSALDCFDSWTDLNYTEEQADLLSAGMEAFIRGSVLGDLYSEIYRSNSICDERLVRVRKKAIMETKQRTIRTNEGSVTFNPSNGKVESYGFQLCSTDDTSSDGYSVVGSWAPRTSLVADQSLFSNAFKDFRGRKLFIGSMEAPPFVMKKSAGNVTYYEGFCINLLQELASRLNFSFEIIEPPDKNWGIKDSNGSWSGVVRMILRGEIEFGIGPITITDQRESDIDFTTPFLEDGVGIITKRVKVDSNAKFRLFTPLQPVVWTCLAASIVGVSLILYFVQRTSPTKPIRQHQDGLTLFACFWSILGSTLNQGSEIEPKSISGRLVLGTWWVFTIIFVSTYTANMAAVLTITIYDKPINSLAQLAAQTEIKPLINLGSSVHSLFKEATSDTYKEIWRQIDGNLVIKGSEEALALVKSQNYAYMTDRSQLEYILLKDCDNFALADEMFNIGGMGFMVPTNAEYLTAFDLIIMKLQESGIIDGWRGQWWASRGNVCSGKERTNAVDQLDLNYLAGPFFIFLGMLGLSIVVVVLERVYVANACQRLRGRILQINIVS